MKSEFTITVKATIPATGAGTEVAGKLVVSPVIGEVSEAVIPPDRTWIIKDVFVTAQSNISVVMNIIKNGEEVVVTTAPIDTLLVSNPSRPTISGIMFESGSRLTATFTTLATVSAQTSVTVYLKVEQVIGGAKEGIVAQISKAFGK